MSDPVALSSEPAESTAPADAMHCDKVQLPPDVPPFYAFADLAGAWAAEAEAARAACLAGRPRGPVTGFARLDRELGGHLHPGLHFVHGEPGAGKTCFALQVAAACGCPAIVVSCEIAPVVLVRRIVARVAGVYQGRLTGGELSPETMAEHFAEAAASCPELAILDATQVYASAADVQAVAEVWRDTRRAASCLVVLDSLHTWAASRSREEDRRPPTEYDSLNDALSELQRLAAALAAPVLVVAERNRASMASAGQSAAKGSARIEYSAESVISLNRDGDGEDWREDANGERAIVAKLAKNRHGNTGRAIPLRFHGALATIREA